VGTGGSGVGVNGGAVWLGVVDRNGVRRPLLSIRAVGLYSYVTWITGEQADRRIPVRSPRAAHMNR